MIFIVVCISWKNKKCFRKPFVTLNVTEFDASYIEGYNIYRVIQEESAILWEMIVCVILSKKVHMNMGPILNGYRNVVKRKY
jgi:hypothetical protein